MALIKCPECENNISDKAKTCLKCGYPLKTKEPMAKKAVPYERFKEINDKYKACREEADELRKQIQQLKQ